jgi:UDPglucose 6-dehydrogenase
MEKNKIGIVGIGTVGTALASVFPRAFLYDNRKKIGSLKEINKADIIFICVNTPYRKKKGSDSSKVESALKAIAGEKIVVIKSTVLPGYTDSLQKKFPRHKVLFNPEFLRQISAKEDIKHPHEQIIGYTKKSKNISKKILKILPKAEKEFIVPAKEAEMIKYFSNTFLAVKVAFSNQIFDLCEKTNIDYEVVKNMAKSNPNFSFSHFNVWKDGYRGYGGACLPKDVKSLIQFGNKKNVDLAILKTVEKINKKLLLINKKSAPLAKEHK